MTENRETKKIHPSPAKSEQADKKSPDQDHHVKNGQSHQDSQTAGSNRALAGTQGEKDEVDVIQEQRTTDEAYESVSSDSGKSDAKKKAG